jgi:hypothetical protein
MPPFSLMESVLRGLDARISELSATEVGPAMIPCIVRTSLSSMTVFERSFVERFTFNRNILVSDHSTAHHTILYNPNEREWILLPSVPSVPPTAPSPDTYFSDDDVLRKFVRCHMRDFFALMEPVPRRAFVGHDKYRSKPSG